MPAATSTAEIFASATSVGGGNPPPPATASCPTTDASQRDLRNPQLDVNVTNFCLRNNSGRDTRYQQLIVEGQITNLTSSAMTPVDAARVFLIQLDGGSTIHPVD